MNHSKLPKKILPFIWHFLKNHKWLLAGLILMEVSIAASHVLRPLYFQKLIDLFPSLPQSTEAFFIALPIIIYGLIAQFMNDGGKTFRNMLSIRLYPQLKREVKTAAYEYVSHHSEKYFSENMSGTISGKINHMGELIKGIIRKVLRHFLHMTLLIIGALALLFQLNTEIALVLLIWLFFSVIVAMRLSMHCYEKARKAEDASLKATGNLNDAVANMSIIHTFNQHKSMLGSLMQFFKKEQREKTKLEKEMMKLFIFVRVTIFALLIGMNFFFVYAYINNILTIGELVLLHALRGRLIDVVWESSEVLISFMPKLGALKTAITIITKRHEIKDRKDAQSLRVPHGKVSFQNINFSYREEDERGRQFITHVFKKLNLHIQPKEKVGIVGLSGSGKTSLANLLLRFYEHKEGSIEIDGQEINRETLYSLRKAITLIPQETSLFNRSLLENIKVGNHQATKAEVEKAAKLAYAHEFIMKTPQKYKTVVGERGMKLSGGQRQRIAIARAFLKNAPILILDEATSALDSESEQYIQKSLQKLMKNKTTLVIAHRLSTLEKMDRIVVLDKGKIVEEGTHIHLLRAGGLYAKMWKIQTRRV